MTIEIYQLSKTIRKRKLLIDVSCHFGSGTISAIIGENGSGKTMLLKAICGFIKPTSGYVSIDGKVVGQDIDYPSNLGFLIETPAFISSYSGIRNLTALASIKNKIDVSHIESCMQAVGLDPNEKKTYRKYSLGMKQKLAIACAIMERPDLLVLDEPTNALDEKGMDNFYSIMCAIAKTGSTVVLASHERKRTSSVSDAVFHMEKGCLKQIK